MAKKRSTKKTSGKKVGKKTTTKKVTKAPARSSSASAKKADAKTMKAIESLAGSVVTAAKRERDPSFDVPSRSLSNTDYDRKAKILRMGSGTSERPLFDLKTARKFMQTMLLSGGVKDLIEADKTLSLRGMFYKSLHTIVGTKEKTLADQTESDAILEDLEVMLGSLREELHIFAKKKGTMVGNVTLLDSGDTIDCRRMGSGGYSIPSICEPSVIQFKKVEADFVLHVEKDTVWQRFNEDRFWETHNCILTEGGGQPSRGVRRLLHRLHDEYNLPIICLLDCDPWGHYIYSVIKQGSISLAFESERLAIPDAKFLGIRSKDYEQCELTDDVQIALNERDITRAKQIAEYPWFADKKPWQLEIKKMLSNGFKMEVESLITKDISYVTETYVPERLAARDWLD
ncbi:MAG: DNA topoisomerase IV subunit A [Planctomycetota bacterium]